jgi:hypothetical protein
MTHISFSRVALLLTLVLTPVCALTSQQNGQSQKIPQFGNADVNVWKSIVMPNAPLVMHTHEHARVIIALTGGTMKIVYENGQSEQHEWETGKAYWLSQEEGKRRHADVNTGAKPIEVMVVELLKDAK